MMKRCDSGHYYDSLKHPGCPYCEAAVSEMGETYAVVPPRPGDGVVASEPPTPTNNPPRSSQAAPVEPETGDVTVAYWGKKGFDPVVGWLVCIEGQEQGLDYRIRRGNNRVGRDRSMDIVISGDPAISRHRHAVVSFDKRTNTFLIREGDGRGLIYLNGDPVMAAARLQPWDIVEFGDGKFCFVPLCGERFQWNVESE